jgi:hypothetical protein
MNSSQSKSDKKENDENWKKVAGNPPTLGTLGKRGVPVIFGEKSFRASAECVFDTLHRASPGSGTSDAKIEL